MIASLGMYDRAEAQPANDRFWALIRDGMRARGLAAPDSLTRGAGAYWDAWQSPDLILSQTCGFPYRAKLHDKVTLIGNLGKDPEMQTLQENIKVAKFSLATSESYKDDKGQAHTSTEWHNVVLWRGLAELAEKVLR